MNGRRIRNEIACLLLTALILGQAVYTSAFPFDNPIIDSIENLFGAIRYDVTIAELVISLLTGAGATPVNNQMAMALETELGTAAYQVGAMYENELFTIVDGVFNDNGFIDAIEDTAVWAQYNLSSIFETTTEDVEAGIATVVGGGALNLGKVLAGAVDTGFIMQAGAAGGILAGAAVGGFGLAYLIDHIHQNWVSSMAQATFLEKNSQVMTALNNVVKNGGGFAGYTSDSRYFYSVKKFPYGNNVISIKVSNANKIWFASNGGDHTIHATGTSTDKETGQTSIINETYFSGSGKSSTTINFGSGNYSQWYADITAINDSQAQSFADSWKNNALQFNRLQQNANKLSPDVIGRSGNMPHSIGQDQNDNDVINFPDLTTPLENGQGLKPINWNDYQDFVNEANQNYTDDPTDQETQAQLWDDFINPYIDDVEDNPTNPDNPDIPDNPEIPDNPDANYVPDFTDEITPDTVIDDVVLDDVIDDVVPDQPVIPDKPDLTPEEIDDNLDVSVTGDITDIFPFCIPFDLIALFEKFGDIDREAPHFHFTLDFGEWLGEERIYEIDIDLSQWDDVATLCRTLEIALFILGLILITRDLIRG